jgi:hypothetical protein
MIDWSTPTSISGPPADALPVDDVELGLLERRGHLVLHDLGPGPVADRLGAVLERLDPAHVVRTDA